MRSFSIERSGRSPLQSRLSSKAGGGRWLLWALAFALHLSAVPASAQSAGATLLLANGKKSPYCIHHAPSSPETVKLAASELQTFFRKATGVTIPIDVGEVLSCRPAIVLGDGRPSRAAGLDLAGIAEGGFRIVADGANVFLLGIDTPDGAHTAEGGSSAGTLNATYTFLEDYLGVRWLMPGEVGESVPMRDKVSIPARLARVESPSFANRRIAYIQNGDPLVVQWLRRQKQGYSLALKHSHAWHELIPPSYYREHPEWFAMIGGSRVPPVGDRYKLETTNPELVHTMAGKIVDEFRRMPNQFTASISPTDSEQWSTSRESLAYMETDPYGRPSVTPLVLNFYENLAREVGRAAPEKKVCGYIYADYLYPPAHGVPPLPANLCLVVAPSFSYGYGLYRPERRADWERVIAAWQSHERLRAYYDLPTVFYPDIGGPTPPGLEILSFIYPRLAAAGYRGIYIFGAAGWGHGALTNYLLAKLNWNAYANVEELAHEFLRRAYGSGASEPIGKLYALIDDAAKSYYLAGGEPGETPDAAMLRSVFAQNLPASISLLQRARKTEASTDEQARLEMLRLSFAELCRVLRRHGLVGANTLPAEFDQLGDDKSMGERPSGFSLAVRTRVTPDPDEISVLAERDIAGGGSADETTLLRGTIKAVLLPQHDGRVQIIVSRLGNIGEGLDYIVYLKNQQVVAKGQLDRDGTIAVDGRRGKPMLLKIEAPSAWFHLDVKGARFALSTAAQRRGIHFIGRYPTIYFYVPDEIGSFRLTISSPSTDQAAAADLVDPNGRIVASLDTSGKLASQVLAKREAPGGYWRLQWKRSWIPHMHNVWVQLDDRLAPWVVVSPQQALEIGASK